MSIPGEEFAPIKSAYGGHEDIVYPSSLGPMSARIYGRGERFSCSDPDDMRAIWRRAALALGATEEEAMRAVFRKCGPSWTWSLRADFGPVWLSGINGAAIADATAALCLHVWGPK